MMLATSIAVQAASAASSVSVGPAPAPLWAGAADHVDAHSVSGVDEDGLRSADRRHAASVAADTRSCA